MILLIISCVCWLGVITFTAKPFFRVVSGKGADHDPLFLAFFVIGWLMIAFNLRWILAPESLLTLAVLRTINIAIAVFVAALVRFYKRS